MTNLIYKESGEDRDVIENGLDLVMTILKAVGTDPEEKDITNGFYIVQGELQDLAANIKSPKIEKLVDSIYEDIFKFEKKVKRLHKALIKAKK
jgi:hypothetical protein